MTRPGLTDVTAFGDSIVFGVNKKLFVSDGTVMGTKQLADVQLYASLSQSQLVGDSLYFACGTPATGTELCVTNKTTAGTRVIDIRPGDKSTSPRLLGEVDGRVMFSVSTPGENYARGWWSSDGTLAGTVELRAAVGSNSAITDQRPPVTFDGRLYIPCYTSGAGYELCASDGTPAGTATLDLVPGSAGSEPLSLAVAGDSLYFTAKSPTMGREVWRSDGTAAGSTVIVDLRTSANSRDSVASTGLVTLGENVLFAARAEGMWNYELWSTDGTAAGTVKLATPAPQTGPDPQTLNLAETIVLGDTLVFLADDAAHGREPWISDGTAAGTRMLENLALPKRNIVVTDATTFGNASYFSVDSHDTDSQVVWRTSGATTGTTQFKQISRQYSPMLTTVGSRMYFVTDDSLWLTDGTTGGTSKIRDIPGNVTTTTALGDKLAFIGTTAGQGYGLWLSDGTAAGTVETGAHNARHLAVANGRLWLSALYGSYGNELYTSDGTLAGTKEVLDINADGDSRPGGFVALGGKTIFAAYDELGQDPWITDGTAAGTRRLADIAAGTGSSNPFALLAWNDMVLMFTRTTGAPTELWRTDGTTATRIKAVTPVDQTVLVPWGDHVYFVAKDAAGTELWRTDGTEAGTVRISDIDPGLASSNPTDLTLAGPDGPLSFVAEEPVRGREVWKLVTPDGTPTIAVDLLPGPRSSRPSHLQPRGESLVLIADDGNGPALFRTGEAPDAVAPMIACPQDMMVAATDATGSIVTFDAPSASDNSGEASVTTSPASGDKFAVGVSTVTATASDTERNTASCTFKVTVAYSGDGDVGGDDEVESDDGGGCSAGGASTWPVGAMLLGLLARRRRR